MAKWTDSNVTIFGSCGEGGDAKVRMDQHVKGLVTVDWTHFMIHQGLVYSVAQMRPNVQDNKSWKMIVQANGLGMHFFAARWIATGKCHLELWGAPDYEGGEVLVPVNQYIGKKLSTGAVILDPEINDPGRYVHSQLLPTHAPEHKITGEWVLPPFAAVMVKVINRSGGAVDMAFNMNFYEEDCASI